MLKEIIQKPKNKIIFVVIMSLFIISCNLILTDGEKTIFDKKVGSDEFNIFFGKWKIKEYLGEGVPYHEERGNYGNKNHKAAALAIQDKYLSKVIDISVNTIDNFYPATELGYYYSDFKELFFVYRPPHEIFTGVILPFFAVSFKHKEFDDDMAFISDANEAAVLTIKGHFFSLEKEEDSR